MLNLAKKKKKKKGADWIYFYVPTPTPTPTLPPPPPPPTKGWEDILFFGMDPIVVGASVGLKLLVRSVT